MTATIANPTISAVGSFVNQSATDEKRSANHSATADESSATQSATDDTAIRYGATGRLVHFFRLF